MKVVLVTGASGFVGLNTIPILLKEGYEVVGVSRHDNILFNKEIKWIKADITSQEHISAVMKDIKPSHILHFAWETTPGKYVTSLDNIKWLQSGIELIQQFYENGGERAVFCGSCFEYDWSDSILNEIGNSMKSLNIYGKSKYFLSQVLAEKSKQEGWSSAWGRIFYTYGPHESPNRLVPSVVKALLKNESCAMSSGRQIRDFMYVKDVANIFVRLLSSNYQGEVNIASGNSMSIRELANLFAHKLGNSDLLQFGKLPDREGEPQIMEADVGILQGQLNLKPTYGHEIGLDETINWWRHQFQPKAMK